MTDIRIDHAAHRVANRKALETIKALITKFELTPYDIFNPFEYVKLTEEEIAITGPIAVNECRKLKFAELKLPSLAYEWTPRQEHELKWAKLVAIEALGQVMSIYGFSCDDAILAKRSKGGMMVDGPDKEAFLEIGRLVREFGIQKKELSDRMVQMRRDRMVQRSFEFTDDALIKLPERMTPNLGCVAPQKSTP